MSRSVPDTDLEIRGGARSSRPLDTGRRGRGRSPKIFFGPFGPQFGKKYEGGAPGAPPLDPPLQMAFSFLRPLSTE